MIPDSKKFEGFLPVYIATAVKKKNNNRAKLIKL